MTSDSLFRQYDPAIDTIMVDGYPYVWHERIKYLVREQADHRCVRCHHRHVGVKDAKRLGITASPGHWSLCDEQCAHGGPTRTTFGPDDMWNDTDAMLTAALREGRVLAEWRVLTVHHLDHDKLNCRWYNLAPLCQRCHLQIQGKVKMDRIWPLEHTDWFKPYVAAYYAHTYLGEDLTRDETAARLDELLDLEDRQLPLT